MAFPIDPHAKAYVCRHVFDGSHPILLVSRADGDWCFLCGANHDEDPSEYRVVGIGHVVSSDKTLSELHDLPADWEAERASADSAWVRTQVDHEAALVKVHFELQEPDMGVSGESLWAASVGQNLYELRNSPWHVRTVNWLDVVEAIPEAEDQLPEFLRVHKRSGHRTIHVFILNEGESRKDEILLRCEELGCTWEGMDDRMYALDFSPEIDIDLPIAYLESLEEAGLVTWRMNEYE